MMKLVMVIHERSARLLMERLEAHRGDEPRPP